jgi:hypothetical protein
VQQRVHAQQRVVVLQRVVAVVVAERTFGMALAGPHFADETELGVGEQRQRAVPRARATQALAEHERREQHLGHVLGQRRDRGEHRGGRAADRDRDRHRATEPFVRGEVEAAALADLHVQAGLVVAEALDAVHAEVAAEPLGMLGVDERQRDERAAVLAPGAQQRQPRQPRRRVVVLQQRCASHVLPADLEQRTEQLALLPQSAEGRRQQRVRQRGEPLHEALGPRPERELHAARRAEQVGDDRPRRALDAPEEQRRAAGRDHAAVHFGGFEVRIDLGVDLDELVFTPQHGEQRAQVGQRLGHLPTSETRPSGNRNVRTIAATRAVAPGAPSRCRTSARPCTAAVRSGPSSHSCSAARCTSSQPPRWWKQNSGTTRRPATRFAAAIHGTLRMLW